MGMIAAVRTAAASHGWTVHASRQEKIGTRELVIVLDDINVEIETTATYHCRSWILMEFSTNSPDTIATDIVSLVHDIEEDIAAGSELGKETFKFIDSEVNQLGTMYRVSITMEYKEVINLD
jgi:hypothetical protein